MLTKIKTSIKSFLGRSELNIQLSPSALVLATYILLLITKLIDLTFINRDNEYLSVVILQMMIFLVPAAIWCRLGGERYTKGLRIRMPKANTIPLIISAGVLMITGGILLSMLFGSLDSLSRNFSLYDTFISKDDGTVPIKLYLILAYAVLPAICEEFVFRGILCREYERGGVARAIVISSLFFGLLHFNLQNLPVYLFAGLILSLTMYATRSLIGAILAHLLYNLFGLFGQPYISTFYNITASTELFIILLGIFFLASGTVFCIQAANLYRQYLLRSHPASYRKPVTLGFENIRNSYLDALLKPSAVSCYIIYMIAVIISFI